MENYNAILTEKLKEYWHYYLEKLKTYNRTSQVYIISFRKSFGKTNRKTD